MSDLPEGRGTKGGPGLAEHTHHWLIGNQDGPSSPAVCKECGERREFSNSFTRRQSPWMARSGAQRRDARKDTGG